MNKYLMGALIIILIFIAFTLKPVFATDYAFRVMTESEPGDYIGQSESWDFSTSSEAIIEVVKAVNNEVRFKIEDFDISYMGFAFASKTGQTLQPGLYVPAKRLPFRGSYNGIEVSGDGRGCNQILGAFYVHEYVLNGTTLEKAAIDFVQICEPNSNDILTDTRPKLYGSIRYNSDFADSCNSQGCNKVKKYLNMIYDWKVEDLSLKYFKASDGLINNGLVETEGYYLTATLKNNSNNYLIEDGPHSFSVEVSSPSGMSNADDNYVLYSRSSNNFFESDDTIEKGTTVDLPFRLLNDLSARSIEITAELSYKDSSELELDNNTTNNTLSRNIAIESLCGNGHIDDGEVCEMNNMNGKSCVALGFSGGILDCNNTCTAYITTNCNSEVNENPDFIVNNIGVKYFSHTEKDATGQAYVSQSGDYYYAEIKNIGDSYTHQSGDTLSLMLEGQAGWLGASNELSYFKQMAANGNYTNGSTFILTGPSANQAYNGTYQIKASVGYKDANNNDVESNVNNNSLTKAITISEPNLIDLKINSVSDPMPNYTTPGVKDIAVYYTATTSGAFKISLLDLNTGYTKSKLQTVGGNVDFSLAPGTYNLRFTIDSENQINESNENNNTFDKSVVINNSGLCFDSDEGKNYLVSGYTRIGDNDGYMDVCQDDNTLIEYYCSINTTGGMHWSVASQTTSCQNGCLNGACLSEIKEIKDKENDHVAIEKIENTENNSLILKLQRQITALEQKVVELEKKLVTKIDNLITQRLAGKVLLQVENKGEAWFVDPKSGNKFYMKDGQTAYEMLKAFGLGITTADLEKIPIGYDERLANDLIDSDGDTLSDTMEEAIGTDPFNPDTDGDGYNDNIEIMGGFNPKGPGTLSFDQELVERLGNGIVLQVAGENARGQAWLLKDGKRFYIDPNNAYNAMRYLSLGITNDNIRKIQVGEFVE